MQRALQLFSEDSSLQVDETDSTYYPQEVPLTLWLTCGSNKFGSPHVRHNIDMT
jgi:hypothetical protein